MEQISLTNYGTNYGESDYIGQRNYDSGIDFDKPHYSVQKSKTNILANSAVEDSTSPQQTHRKRLSVFQAALTLLRLPVDPCDIKKSFSYLKRQLSILSPTLNRKKGNAKQTTKRLTNIVRLALQAYGYSVVREFEIPLKRSGKLKDGTTYHMNGRIDLYAESPNGKKIAIEIDRANKIWSLTKLNFCNKELDMLPVWIRWKGTIVEVLNSILLFDLTEPDIKTINQNTISSFFKLKN